MPVGNNSVFVSVHSPSRVKTKRIGQLSFGRFLTELRQSRGMSQKMLAFKARLAASTLSELENRRRLPPPESTVLALSQALKASADEQRILIQLADEARAGIGVRVSRTMPAHVAQLLRELACLSHRLSPTETRSLQLYAKDLAMK
jgi:transcriptional regulator with XRE-family HTH domain